MLTRPHELTLRLEADPTDDAARAELVGLLADRGQLDLAAKHAGLAGTLPEGLGQRLEAARARPPGLALELPRRRLPFLRTCAGLFALALLAWTPTALTLAWPQIKLELDARERLRLLDDGETQGERLTALNWLKLKYPERVSSAQALAVLAWNDPDADLALRLLHIAAFLEEVLDDEQRAGVLVHGLDHADVAVRRKAVHYLEREKLLSWQVYARLERAYAEDLALRPELLKALTRPPRQPEGLRDDALARLDERIRAAIELQDVPALRDRALELLIHVRIQQDERDAWVALILDQLDAPGRQGEAALELGLKLAVPEAGQRALSRARDRRWRKASYWGRQLEHFAVAQLQAWYDAEANERAKSVLAGELGRRGVVVVDPLANRRKKKKKR